MNLSKCDLMFILFFTFMQLRIILTYYGGANKKSDVRRFVCVHEFYSGVLLVFKGVRNENLKIGNGISLRYRMVILRKAIM